MILVVADPVLQSMHMLIFVLCRPTYTIAAAVRLPEIKCICHITKRLLFVVALWLYSQDSGRTRVQFPVRGQSIYNNHAMGLISWAGIDSPPESCLNCDW